MKKTTITIFAALLMMTGVMAQTIQEGMGHLYAKRYKSATDVFQKLIAVNPNDANAIYWLGQAYFNMDDNTAARQLYEKALISTNNHPLMMVGIGHADLLDNKNNDARQRFEAAITATRNPRKGDDPIIQTAIGRAIVDSKTGDFNWAVQLLESATSKDLKNTEAWLQLGNAYRKAGEGTGGGKAFTAYNKALEVNPSFAVASIRLAKLFESQKNWEFVLKYLNEAITRDAKFSDAYYELFWYHFLRRNFTEANNQLTKYKESKLPEADIQDEYLNGQLCYVSKDFDCAITKANNVLTVSGTKAKPRIYKLLFYSYFDKGDYQNGLTNANLYFNREKKEDITPLDLKMYADILGKTGADSITLFNAYMAAVNADTLITSKVDMLKDIAKKFKDEKKRNTEAAVLEKLIETKPKPTINDYFDVTVAYYFGKDYPRSRDKALVMRDDKFTDQIYGYEWAFNNSQIIDTVRKDSIAVPDAIKLHDFVFQDTVKYKKQYISASRFLGGYYVNDAKDYEKSLIYFQKWHDSDTANAVKIEEYMDQIRKMLQQKGTKPAGATPTKGATPAKATGNKPSAAKPKATTTTKAVVKK
ncbi:MAG: tetratricopeptide repeat protein [Chitinophagaceae bacterium]|nr:tetratricopeptide repeat protein [Chitinophagaceae bacterium]